MTKPSVLLRLVTVAVASILLLSLVGCPPTPPVEGEGEGEGEPVEGEGEGEPFDTDTIMLPGDVPLEMVWIPAGTFQMGRYPGEQDSFDREDPQHEVTLSRGFWMGKYEVTQAQWDAVAATNPSMFSGANLPVENVSWNDTQSFITVLNSLTGKTFRLPTEAEWEYACRAGTTTRFYWGDDPIYSEIDSYAWYGDNSGSQTHDVGGKLPNAWGLYDMSGNVWEYCQDWYGTYPSRSVTDPTGPASGTDRVFRGGSWRRSQDPITTQDLGYRYRSAYRNATFLPDITYDDLGFRLAR